MLKPFQSPFERGKNNPIKMCIRDRNVLWDIETVKPNHVHEKMCELVGLSLIHIYQKRKDKQGIEPPKIRSAIRSAADEFFVIVP